MTRDEKNIELQNLTQQVAELNSFVLADSSTLDVAKITQFRRLCHKNGVTMKVVKNTLLRKALEASDQDYGDLMNLLVGPTSLMYASEAKYSAKVIKDFRDEENEKPLLKGAYVDGSIFIGDDKLKELANLKSKSELIAEVISLLEAPMMNVLSSLNSAERSIAGVVKTLSERKE